MARVVAGLAAVRADGVVSQARFCQRIAAPLRAHENAAQVQTQDGVCDLAYEADGNGGIDD
eukprot:3493788-Lingulodinium_polyedra.AAC.1